MWELSCVTPVWHMETFPVADCWGCRWLVPPEIQNLVLEVCWTRIYLSSCLSALWRTGQQISPGNSLLSPDWQQTICFIILLLQIQASFIYFKEAITGLQLLRNIYLIDWLKVIWVRLKSLSFRIAVSVFIKSSWRSSSWWYSHLMWWFWQQHGENCTMFLQQNGESRWQSWC